MGETIAELASLVRADCDADVEAAPTVHGKLCEKVLYGDPYGDAPCDCDWPARVLSEVASKRALLDEVLDWEHDSECWAETPNPHLGKPDNRLLVCDCDRDERVRAVLTCLAQPYQS